MSMDKAEVLVLFAMQLAMLIVAIRTARDTVESKGFLFFQSFCFCVSVFLGAVVFGIFGLRPQVQNWMVLPMVAGFGSLILSIKPPKREVIKAVDKALIHAPADKRPQAEEKEAAGVSNGEQGL